MEDMRVTGGRRRASANLFRAALLGAAALAFGGAETAPDPLAGDVARWSTFLATNPAKDETWTQVRDGAAAALARVEAALKAQRRLLALLRFAQVRENLYAARYLGERPAAERSDLAAFEAEWRRLEPVLAADLAPAPSRLAGLRPVALRAMAEAAQAKVPVYYRASLEYGRNTTADSGLFYLGAAQAQRDFVELARRLSASAGPPAPEVRALGPGLDALQAEVLAAYRPPASVEKHPEFITISALIKEARELAASGATYGALLRYLQAAVRFAGLGALPTTDTASVSAQLRAHEARLVASPADHSLGRLLVEYAEADLAEHATDGAAVLGPAIARDVLPRYFAALEAPPDRPRAPAPSVTVTLVRWPYT
jgi:hypothetical protein